MLYYTYGHWQAETEKPDTSVAFVYTITFPDLDKSYIGAKTTNRKWESYRSSSKYVKNILKEDVNAEFKILKWFDTKREAEVYERQYQLGNDVLNNDYWLNQTIGGSLQGGTYDNKSRYHTPEGVFKSMGEVARHYNRSAQRMSQLFESDLLRYKNWYKSTPDCPNHKTTMKFREKASRGPAKVYKGVTYHTPAGTFTSLGEAIEANGIAGGTLKYRCRSNSVKFAEWSLVDTTGKLDNIEVTSQASKVWVTPLGEYTKQKEAAEAHNITPNALKNRCLSNSPKWSDYSVK